MTSKTLHGVNLGGWLILEKWMTPSLFSGTDARDEYEFSLIPGGLEKIKIHRSTFITEEDFRWMHAHGLNAVRIPVGYWVLDGGAPFISATTELDWAMEMAKKYDLEVIIDLHGLIGSQNGQDHSGRVGDSNWYKNVQYRQATLDTLEVLAKRYKDYPNLWGLQIINEPKLGLFQLKLRRFYKDVYRRLDQILGPHTHIIFSDAFTPRLLSGALGRRKNRVVMDVHFYHMTTLFSQLLSIKWFMNKTTRRGRLLKRLSKTQPVIIGEWSGAMRNETIRGIPRREQDIILREYMQLQIGIYENTAGWFYWNYKTDAPGIWNFRSQIDDDVIVLID